MSDWTPYSIERPHDRLFRYYLVVSILSTVMFPFVFLPLYFKYHTLRYRFDDEGVKMSWGIIFRREIFLTYGRIQDIHVTRNLLERWLGLGTVAIQTASGSAGPEMSVVGLLEHEAVRDFLYGRMRGARDEARPDPVEAGAGDEVTVLLREIRDDLGRAAAALEARGERS